MKHANVIEFALGYDNKHFVHVMHHKITSIDNLTFIIWNVFSLQIVFL